MTNDQLTAIVLAGGKSSRMGEDKALIPIQGVPMLELVCRTAQSCAEQVYIVTPWQERYQNLLLSKSQFIQEMPWWEAHGPLIGFAQGLAHVQTEWALLLACDLPKLQVNVLQKWIAQLESVEDEAIAALAHHHQRWEPLCGFYRRRCLPKLMEYINQGGRSFQEWLKQHPIHVLALAESDMLFNCNTPKDLRLL